jgi:hypothetical protein
MLIKEIWRKNGLDMFSVPLSENNTEASEYTKWGKSFWQKLLDSHASNWFLGDTK